MIDLFWWSRNRETQSSYSFQFQTKTCQLHEQTHITESTKHLLDQVSYTGYVFSAVQASLRQPRNQPNTLYSQLYRLHFGNPEISPTGFHFHHFLPNYSMEC